MIIFNLLLAVMTIGVTIFFSIGVAIIAHALQDVDEPKVRYVALFGFGAMSFSGVGMLVYIIIHLIAKSLTLLLGK
jgi:hypothetical protein